MDDRRVVTSIGPGTVRYETRGQACVELDTGELIVFPSGAVKEPLPREDVEADKRE